MKPSHLVSGFHSRGKLPHLKHEGAGYFVTFRLGDSLPHEVVERLKSYNHWIRDDQEPARFCTYVVNNPVKARLCEQAEDWPWSSAHPGAARFLPDRKAK